VKLTVGIAQARPAVLDLERAVDKACFWIAEAIIGPDGRYLVEPVLGREELLLAEIDLRRTREEKLTLDVTGHYARPELFDLRVRRERPAQFRDDAGPFAAKDAS